VLAVDWAWPDQVSTRLSGGTFLRRRGGGKARELRQPGDPSAAVTAKKKKTGAQLSDGPYAVEPEEGIDRMAEGKVADGQRLRPAGHTSARQLFM